MFRTGSTFLMVILTGGATGCLLYTDTINVAPIVMITPPGQVYRNKSVSVIARAHDPDQDAGTLQYDWGIGPTPCPDEASARSSVSRGLGTFPFSQDHIGEFCVWVFVTDREGAQAFDSSPVTVVNQEPTAVIKVVSPTTMGAFDLYSTVRLSATSSSDADGDPLTYTWKLTYPDGRVTIPTACSTGGDPREICFNADAPGGYQADLVVSDALTPVSTSLLLTVNADRFPCITNTDPPYSLRLVRNPEEDDVQMSILTVDDDGDPIPPVNGGASGAESFRWSRRLDETGEFERLAWYASSFTIPKRRYRSGDVVEMRVEYHDRVERDMSPCRKPEARLCKLDPQRACYQAITWTIVYL